MSKVAKKRIAALVLIVVFILLTMSLNPSSKIVGEWASVGAEEEVRMDFASDNTVVITVKDADKNIYKTEPLYYELNGEELTISQIEESATKLESLPFSANKLVAKASVTTKLPIAVYRMVVDGIKLEKTNFIIAPIFVYFILIIMVFVILWCFEEDINVLLNAFLSKFKGKKKYKLTPDEKKALKAKAKREAADKKEAAKAAKESK